MKKESANRWFLSLVIATCLFSCKKEITVPQPPCNPCTTHPPTTIARYIQDSIWERKTDHEYTSDLNALILLDGVNPEQINTLYIVSDQTIQEIPPNGRIDFMGGVIYCSTKSSSNYVGSKLTFFFPNAESHFGELPPAGPLPFHTIQVKVLSLK